MNGTDQKAKEEFERLKKEDPFFALLLGYSEELDGRACFEKFSSEYQINDEEWLVLLMSACDMIKIRHPELDFSHRPEPSQLEAIASPDQGDRCP